MQMRMQMRFFPALAALLLAGCSSVFLAPTRNEILSQEAEGKALMEKARRGEDSGQSRTNTGVERIDGFWLPAKKLSELDAETFAARSSARRISINRDFSDIQSVAERLTSITGMSVVVSPDAAINPAAPAQNPGGATGLAATFSGAGNLPMPGLPSPGSVSGAVNATPVWLSYDGALSGFLDLAAARFSLSWEWLPSGGVRFFRYTTKIFRLVALPGGTTLQTTIGNQGGGSGGSGGSSTPSSSGSSGGSGGSGGSSSQQAGVSYSGLSVWAAIQDGVKGMLSASGKMAVSEAIGTVTVTDTPQVVEQIGRFIAEQNASLGKQVIVNVRVLSVDITSTDDYGINWNLAYQSMSGKTGFNFTNTFEAASSAPNLILKILSTAGSVTNSSIKSWQGSNALIAALSKQGNVSQITSASLTTLNNQVAPLQVARQTSYLASSATTVNPLGGNTTTLQPGVVTTGFSMSVVPHMLDKGKLMLQYAINISSLLGLNSVSSGGSSIQTPDIDTRNFIQRVMLNSGDTLVMTGFEQSNLDGSTSGVGNADNTMLGGGIITKKARAVLVILIQPIVVDL